MMVSSHLKSELVGGLTAYRYLNNKIGDLCVQLLREFELIGKSHFSITERNK